MIVNVIKVPHVNELFGVRSDHKGKFDTHVLDRLAHVGFSDLVELLRRAPLPELDLAVPASAHEDVLVVFRHVVDIFNGLRVGSYLLD